MLTGPYSPFIKWTEDPFLPPPPSSGCYDVYLLAYGCVCPASSMSLGTLIDVQVSILLFRKTLFTRLRLG